jgi:3-oxoacyl-[acyl-carrier protein] reductase
MKNLSNRVVMVTGGATGIGATVVQQFARAGYAVACCYNKSEEAAQALAARLAHEKKEILTVKMDVARSSEVRPGIALISSHFGGPITVLVNNAGDVIKTAPVEEMDEELWDLVLAVNLKGAFLCAKHCIPGMKSSGWGRIINVSSISARSGGGPGAAHYAASKAGVESLTRSLAKEVAPFNITVNAVSPGVVLTPIHERHNTPETLERLRQLVPLQRLGEPEEVASVVEFLASEGASYVTGAIVPINGGMRMD